MSPELLAQIGLAAGASVASGLRLYATVAALGLLHRLDVLRLPAGLEVLSHLPIIADPKREVAALYDMIHPNADNTFTVRSVFIIGPDRKVKLTLTYPASTGRNFLEMLRVIDSLQLTAKFKVATPADWQDGHDCIITTAVKDEEIPAHFPKGHRRVKPYLRYTPQPNK